MVVVAVSLAAQLFRDESRAVGQTLRINGELYDVIGTIDDRAAVPDGAQFWIPIDARGRSETASLQGLARVRSPADAAVVHQRLAETLRSAPEAQSGAFVDLPFGSTRVGDVGGALLTLSFSLAGALLLASLNVGGLLLKRVLERLPEYALCAALGATTSHLVLPILGEAVVIAAASGVIAVPMALAARHVMGGLFTATTNVPVVIPADFQAGLSGLAVVMLVTGLVSLLPILAVRERKLRHLIQAGGAATTPGREHLRVGRYLLGGQTLLAVLCVGASAAVGDVFYRASHIPLGYDATRYVWTAVALPTDSTWTPARRKQFASAFSDTLRAMSRTQVAAVWEVTSLRPAPRTSSGSWHSR